MAFIENIKKHFAMLERGKYKDDYIIKQWKADLKLLEKERDKSLKLTAENHKLKQIILEKEKKQKKKKPQKVNPYLRIKQNVNKLRQLRMP